MDLLHSSPPPPYSEHQYDLPYNDALRPPQRQRASMLDVSPSYEFDGSSQPQLSQPLSSATLSSQPLPAAAVAPPKSVKWNILQLTIVQRTIFATDANGDMEPLYHLPRDLSWSGNEISLQRALTFTSNTPDARLRRPGDKNETLYILRRIPFSHELSLIPQKKSCYVRAPIKMLRDVGLSGKSWELFFNIKTHDKPFLKQKRKTWREVLAASESVIAQESSKIDSSGNQVETLDFEASELDPAYRDLIVAAWIGKVWMEGMSDRISATPVYKHNGLGKLTLPRLGAK